MFCTRPFTQEEKCLHYRAGLKLFLEHQRGERPIRRIAENVVIWMMECARPCKECREITFRALSPNGYGLYMDVVKAIVHEMENIVHPPATITDLFTDEGENDDR